MINPGTIVFGGGLGVYLDHFKKGLIERLLKTLPEDVVSDLKMHKAAYGDNSAIMGGCTLIFQDN